MQSGGRVRPVISAVALVTSLLFSLVPFLPAPAPVLAAETHTGQVLFTDATSTEVQYYAGSGVSATITLWDPDLNTDPGVAETALVQVTSSTQTSAETVTLTETGVDTGVFRHSIAFDTSGSVGVDGDLDVHSGDGLRVGYSDAADGYGNAAEATDTAIYAAAVYYGSITDNTTWTAADSPCIIVGDVTVNAGVALTIDPGVTVEFLAGYDEVNAGQWNDACEFTVLGHLVAPGTEANPVIFTSTAASPQPGDWGQMVFRGGATAAMTYCQVKYGRSGICGWNSSRLDLADCLVDGFSASGIDIDGAGNHGTILRTQVQNCGALPIGIRNGSDIALVDCTGTGNGETVLRVEDANPLIRGGSYTNTDNVSGHLFSGIYVFAGSPTSGIPQAIRDCEISGGHYGLKFDWWIFQPPPAVLPVENCTISGQVGVSLYDRAKMAMNYCDLSGVTSVGVDNDMYDQDCRYNYWGDNVTAEMNAGGNPKNIGFIFDRYDTPDRGYVDYSGWFDAMGAPPAGGTVTGTVSFTDAAGNGVPYYTAGPATITVEDADLNTDPGMADTAHVAVTSSTQAIGETVILTETGNDTGVFRGSVAFDTSGSVGAGDGDLDVRQGDGLQVSYSDVADGYGNARVATDAAVYTATAYHGPIASDTHWTATASPYIIVGDVTVNAGVTLTVDPGVTVKFLAGYDQGNVGQWINASELIVLGQMVAPGTAESPIVFTSTAVSPQPGDWGKILFRAGGGADMTYCQVRYGMDGISSFGNSTVDLADCLVEQCSDSGILIDGAGSHGTILRTEAYNCPAGFYIRNDSDITLRDCTGAGNGETVLRLENANPLVEGGSFTNTENVSGTTYHSAIYVYSGYNNTARIPQAIRNCKISGGQWGLKYDWQISQFPAPVRELPVENCTISGVVPLRLDDNAWMAMHNCDVSHYSSAAISNGWHAQNCQSNYWGAAATTQMNEGGNPKNVNCIWDEYDYQQGFGHVDYSSWLDAPGASAGGAHTGTVLFTDEEGNRVHYYAGSGGAATVTLSDADLNTDPGAAETAWVAVTGSAQAAAENVTLTETGIDTGLFRGSIALDTSGTVGVDGDLDVRSGDGLQVTYSDAADAYGNAAVATDTSVYATAPKHGHITGDAHWTAADSPCIISGDLTVHTGATLTIDPGVTVKLLAGYDQEGGGRWNDACELTVLGHLAAQGTPEDPIIFTSTAASPQPGDWGQIVFQSGGTAAMAHCQVEYGTNGISGFGNSTLDVADCRVERCSGSGIEIDGAGCHGAIVGTEAHNCVTAIYIRNDSDITLRDSTGTGDGEAVLRVDNANPLVEGCSFTNTHNVSGDLFSAVYLYATWANASKIPQAIRRCEISGSNFGLKYDWWIYQAPPATLPVENCTISGQVAVSLYDRAKIVMRYCDLSGVTSACVANDMYDQDCQYNYWGDNVTAEMDAGGNPKNIGFIFDKYDYGGYGRVNYANWLNTSPVGEPPAITGFTIPGQAGDTVINQGDLTIGVTMPFGTDVTVLVPTISITGDSVDPPSGVVRDFTSPVTYTVTAGSITQSYTITVTVGPSSGKAITSFAFNALVPPVAGVIDEGAKTVTLTVPFGTDVTALVPTITHAGASVDPPGGAPQDYTSPVIHTVTAADASTQDYLVTVTVAPPLMVTSPNGGEGWAPYTTKTITWIPTGVTGNVNVQLSRNGGNTYSTIISNTANDGTQAWTVTTPVTSAARIKVSSVANPATVFDVSNANFAIVAPPQAPVLALPMSGSTVATLTPTLDWNNSTGATTYGVQVSAVSTFATKLVDKGGVPTSTYAVDGADGLEWNKTYYWRAGAVNNWDMSSPWSAYRTFKTAIGPPPEKPGNLTTIAVSPTQINLSWTDNSTDETGFKIERKKEGALAFTQIATVGPGVEFYSNTTGLTANTGYVYRVRAYKGATLNSAYCDEKAATTLPLPPAAPTLLLPASSAVVPTLTPSLDWNEPAGAVSYNVQVSAASSFAAPFVNANVGAASTYDIAGADSLAWNTTYYWRANAVNIFGSASRWSAYRMFKTALGPPPNAPNNLVATPAAANQVNLTWDDNSLNETGFKIERRIGAGAFTQIGMTGAGVNHYNSVGLTPNTQYSYRVRAYLVTLNSGYTDIASATTPPLAPTLRLPNNGVMNQPSEITLQWNIATGAISYRVQVSTSQVFAGILDVDEPLPGLSYVAPFHTSTKYYWRVNATNGAGSTSAWSAVRNFTTGP